MQTVVTVLGGVTEIFAEGDEPGVVIIDFDEWNDADVSNDWRQEKIYDATAAGLRVVIYNARNKRWNIQLFKPDDNYAAWITDNIRDDEWFAVYDPGEVVTS